MHDINEELDYYLARLREIGGGDDLFCNLTHLGRGVLPRLMREAEQPEHRAFLVHVIWQIRDRSAVDFLGAALSDPDPEVWKEALDGLVTLGGPTALGWIDRMLEQVGQGELPNGLSEEWLREAREQMVERERS
jgi:hypothetical protein